jgi:hypothetical protein
MSKEFEGNSPEEFEQLTNRIQAADPAASIDVPSEAHLETLLNRAANEAGGERRFFSPRQRIQWVRGLTTVGVMAAAMALILPSVLGFGNTGNGGYLFSLGANGGNQASAAKVAGGAASQDMAMCLGPCFNTTQFRFHADTSLSDQSSNAEIFKLVPTRGPGQTLNAVAEVFGLQAPTFAQEPAAGDTWGSLYKGWDPNSKTNPSGEIASVYYDTRSMISNWSYNANNMRWTTCEYQDAAAKGEPVPLVDINKIDPNVTSTCTAGLSGYAPTTAQALVLAAKYFKALGYDSNTNLSKVADGDLYLVGPQDSEDPNNNHGRSIQVYGYLKVAGGLTPLSMYVGWDGSNSELAYAGGFDGKVASQGSFGTVSAAAGVDRLSKWQWFGTPYLDWTNIQYSQHMSGPIAYDAVGTNTGSTDVGITNSVAPDSATGSGTAPAASSAPASSSAPDASGAPGNPGSGVAPTPVDPSATPEPDPTPVVIDVTVTKAQNALMLVYGEDGSIWFVPGYVYFDSTGYVGSVLAIVEGIIKLPEVTPMMTK